MRLISVCPSDRGTGVIVQMQRSTQAENPAADFSKILTIRADAPEFWARTGRPIGNLRGRFPLQARFRVGTHAICSVHCEMIRFVIAPQQKSRGVRCGAAPCRAAARFLLSACPYLPVSGRIADRK